MTDQASERALAKIAFLDDDELIVFRGPEGEKMRLTARELRRMVRDGEFSNFAVEDGDPDVPTTNVMQ